VDLNLREGQHRLENFLYKSKLDTNTGVVMEAEDRDGQSVVVKVISKWKHMLPADLEGFYREFRFLSGILRHPHTARVIQILHSSTNLYLIFESAGKMNLQQLVSSLKPQRVESNLALDCFNQIGSALVFCHSKDVTHRRVALEHIVTNQLDNDTYHCKLVDFHSAMVSRGTSKAICGRLPCIAPEMALGLSYVGRLADAWSLGVVLLEVAGGLTCLKTAVSYDAQAEMRDVAPSILEFFRKPGSQVKALACLGAGYHHEIGVKLGSLLKPEAGRVPISELVLQ